ncbi:unnamed protein product, partial [Acanthocheilonema viteae]
ILKRQIDYNDIASIGLSPYQDNFIILNVRDSYTSLLETPLKTELINAINKWYHKMAGGRILSLDFNNSHQIILKKTRFGGGGSRTVKFSRNDNGSDSTQLLPKGKILFVSIGPGLSSSTKLNNERIAMKQHYERRKMPLKAYQTFPSSQHVNTSNGVYPIINNNNTNIGRNSGITHARNAMKHSEKPMPPLKPKPLPFVEALYAYEAQDTDELSFIAGDKFELVNKDASGWWQGRMQNRTGLFPGNYVKEL